MRLTRDDQMILDSLSERGGDLVGRAVDWCAINSGSRNTAGLTDTLKVLVKASEDSLPGGELTLEPLAPTVEIAADGSEKVQKYTPSILVTARPDAPVQVVLTGHYDTVFPAESRFQAVTTRADGALNGPGIADMKGGISMLLGALEAFEAHPDAKNVGYRLLLSPDEEIGSLASGPVLARIGALGHVGLTYEPALADGTLASERKGSGNFHVKITGRAAHAGRDFALGRNAITAAARIAGALDGLNGKRDGVTLNVARIDGGSPLNQVPDIAVVRFNVRFPDAEAGGWLRLKIEEAMKAGQGDGLTVSLHGGFTRPAKPFNAAQSALFGAVKEAGALLGQEIAWKSSGGVCEGNNLFAVGLPNVDTLGVRGGDIHSENEFAWPDSFAERARLSALILMKLASGEIDAHGIHALMKASA
ncbi:glutamate carboxypeptidase [Caulobacter ginsengisoli]|uniref:Glutamate carboxypeptidase n=1 Tax=Caulobacter ginsengisoli TaxID=400775 RepID=A0ABU0IPP5_9CAUL|nr:hydrolase [Caulobacter ginsengisoli]MDQ0463974.1 glutamate carboxypeptidase [Caulobacter ginsengisoli]